MGHERVRDGPVLVRSRLLGVALGLISGPVAVARLVLRSVRAVSDHPLGPLSLPGSLLVGAALAIQVLSGEPVRPRVGAALALFGPPALALALARAWPAPFGRHVVETTLGLWGVLGLVAIFALLARAPSRPAPPLRGLLLPPAVLPAFAVLARSLDGGRVDRGEAGWLHVRGQLQGRRLEVTSRADGHAELRLRLELEGDHRWRSEGPPAPPPLLERPIDALRRRLGWPALEADGAGLVATWRAALADDALRRVGVRLAALTAFAERLEAGAVGPRVVPRERPADCPYCKDVMAPAEAAACDRCGTLHHGACLAEHGRCTVLGCTGGTLPEARERA